MGCPERAEVLRLSRSLFPEPLALAGRDECFRFVENHLGLIAPLDNRFWECDKVMPHNAWLNTSGPTSKLAEPTSFECWQIPC